MPEKISLSALKRTIELADMPDHAIDGLGETLPADWDVRAIEALPTLLAIAEAAIEERDEARAALAAAEQEKEKAVAEEREACAVIAENSGEPFNDEIACATRQTALSVALKIRARAGRGDEQQK